MEASEKIVIDLTKCMANVGEKQPFEGTFSLSDSLLPYPNAHLVQATVKLNVLFLNPQVEAEGEIDGHYLLVSSREAEITFCVTERSGAPLVWIAAAAAVLITAAAVYYLCRIRPLRREKAREKAG